MGVVSKDMKILSRHSLIHDARHVSYDGSKMRLFVEQIACNMGKFRDIIVRSNDDMV